MGGKNMTEETTTTMTIAETLQKDYYEASRDAFNSETPAAEAQAKMEKFDAAINELYQQASFVVNDGISIWFTYLDGSSLDKNDGRVLTVNPIIAEGKAKFCKQALEDPNAKIDIDLSEYGADCRRNPTKDRWQ
jgi:hypothetical protein